MTGCNMWTSNHEWNNREKCKGSLLLRLHDTLVTALCLLVKVRKQSEAGNIVLY